MRRVTPLLLLLFSSTQGHADGICDPGSNFFLSPELRARWCPAGSGAAKTRAAAPRSPTRDSGGIRANRSDDDDDEEEDDDDEEEEEEEENDSDNDEDRVPPKRIAPPARTPPRPAPEAKSDPAPAAIERKETPTAGTSPASRIPGDGAGCAMKNLRFSANDFPAVPARGSPIVWGGNATEGNHVIDPPYSSGFLSRVKKARENGVEVFAYLEGPCGDTGGRDDGERARCARLHRSYNQRFAKATSDSALHRWKPYTFAQLRQSGKYGIGHCEIDNLDNNIKVPLIPLLKEIKAAFDKGEIYCRLVLKNLSVRDIDEIRSRIAPTPPDAAFVSPFHIYEAGNGSMKRSLDAAMQRLKGTSSTTIIDLDTNRYGERQIRSPFLSCGK